MSEVMYSKLRELFDKSEPEFRKRYDNFRKQLKLFETELAKYNSEHFFYNDPPEDKEKFDEIISKIYDVRRKIIQLIREMKSKNTPTF